MDEKDETKDKGVTIGMADKLVGRFQSYGKVIIILGGVFVAAIMFYLKVNATADLSISNEKELRELQVKYSKDLIELKKSFEESVEQEFKIRDRRSKKRYDRAMEVASELKHENRELRQKVKQNENDIKYMHGYQQCLKDLRFYNR